MSKVDLQPISKIEKKFNAYDPSKINDGYTPELGNYEWYLYQYRAADKLDIEILRSDDHYRNSLSPHGQFTASKIVDYQSFLRFLIMNYRGWAPYGKGMPDEKARGLAEKLITSFLFCQPAEAIYIEYAGDGGRPGQSCTVPGINSPYLISGVYGIFDPIHQEFFELIMGGSD